MRIVLLLFASLAGGSAPAHRPLVPPTIGAQVPDVEVKDLAGKHRALSEFKAKKAIVVVFVGTECPIANLYLPVLAEMHKHYSGEGVQFLAINSNDQDTFAEVVAHARDRKIPFPVLKDDGQRAADAFGARRTPEAFLLDANRTIRYRGRIDDRNGYLYRRDVPTRAELKDALDELLAGKPIKVPESEVFGCLIGRTRKEGAKTHQGQ
jgi:peroxiredoxin